MMGRGGDERVRLGQRRTIPLLITAGFRIMEYFLSVFFQSEMPAGIIRTDPPEKAFGFYRPPADEEG
jgi:hypothetical protein